MCVCVNVGVCVCVCVCEYASVCVCVLCVFYLAVEHSLLFEAEVLWGVGYHGEGGFGVMPETGRVAY